MALLVSQFSWHFIRVCCPIVPVNRTGGLDGAQLIKLSLGSLAQHVVKVSAVSDRPAAYQSLAGICSTIGKIYCLGVRHGNKPRGQCLKSVKFLFSNTGLNVKLLVFG